MTKTKTILIKLEGTGGVHRAGVNGKFFEIPVGREYPAEPELVETLRNSGVSFTEVSSDEAGSDGGVRSELASDAPPAMTPRSVDDSVTSGDESGDVTTGPENKGDGFNDDGLSIEEHAKRSDELVAKERSGEIDLTNPSLAAEPAPQTVRAAEAAAKGSPVAKAAKKPPAAKKAPAKK